MVKINENYLLLQNSYLFVEVNRRAAKYMEENPDKNVIKMGIGDVTKPLAPAIVDAFKAAAEKMGATALPHGDAGYQFDLIGGYQMQIMVWAGDEEFPPNAQVLYSDNFAEGFAAEDRVVAGDILITAIKANM